VKVNYLFNKKVFSNGFAQDCAKCKSSFLRKWSLWTFGTRRGRLFWTNSL